MQATRRRRPRALQILREIFATFFCRADGEMPG